MNNEIITEKECYRCHNTKSIERFYRISKDLEKRWTICIDCENKRQRIRNKENERCCRNCGFIKPIEEFKRNANNTRRKHCLECYEKITPTSQKQRDDKTKNRHRETDLKCKKRYKQSSANREYILFKSARTRAKAKQVPFTITKEDIIIPDICPVLGIKLESGTKEDKLKSPSLDKVIPEIGYIKNNIMVISFKANWIKNFGTADEHEKVAQYIRENSPQQIEYYI